MRKEFFLPVVLSSLLHYSCNRKQEQQSGYDPNAPKVVQAGEYKISMDSMALPEIVPAANVKSVRAGQPIIINIIPNVYSVISPKIILAGIPRSITPGSDTFLLPKPVPAAGISFVATMPEVIVAKDAYIRDNNPDNFSSFQIKQGLKHNIIRCMIQDKAGNLWFGTYGGGASKYDGKYFTHYTTAQGLSNDAVYSLLEDKSGNLWFGTFGGGINKYDGKTFIRYSTKEGLSNNNVYCIVEDKKGNYWFGTNGGVTKFDGKQFTNYTVAQGLGNNFVHCILEDKNGVLWFGTNGGGVSRYDGNAFMNYTTAQGLSDDVVYTILEDKTGNLWFGTNSGINKYDGKFITHYTNPGNLSSDVVLSTLKDKNENLWFGTSGGGITKFDGKTFTHYTSAQGLSSDFIYSMLEDKTGNLWFGTKGGGINKYDGRLFSLYTTAMGLSHNEVMSILEDQSGVLWFGTWGGGVSKYNGKSLPAGQASFTNYSTAQGLINDVVYCILQDKTRNLWFGTDAGVSKYDGKTFTNYSAAQGFTNAGVWNITEDRKGNLWFCTYGNGVIKYDGINFTHYTTAQGLSNDKVLCGMEDKAGNLWFGTWGGGVNKYDGKSFSHFTTAQGLSNDEVMSLLEDRNGNLWIGTIGGGINKYDGKSLPAGQASFTYYTTAQGLSNDNLTSILEDKSGNLWFGTRYGLNRMMPDAKERKDKTKINNGALFKSYLVADGFLGLNCFKNSILEDSHGNIWIGTGDRLACYHSNGEIPDTIPPNIQLSNVALYNENINWESLEKKKDTTLILGNGVRVSNFKFDSVTKWSGIPEHLNLAYNNNYLTFKFIGITTKSPYKIKYQYKLDGLDENWNAITDRTEAPYGNLPGGNYTFKVKAMNSEGYWSKEAKYAFTVRPPWWKTWWFRVLAIAAIVTAAYVLYRLRLNQVLRLQNIRNKIAGDLHDDIGSTLSSINLFTELARKQSKEVSPLLERIGEDSRKMLDSMGDIVWSIHPENDTSEKIILRMRSFAFDLLGAKNIAFEFNADESIEKLKLTMNIRKNLYLIFKEAANNMAKYSEASKAMFSISYSEHQLTFLIHDNGKGFDMNKITQGNGLKNMQRRANEIGAQIKIDSGTGTGTSIELHIVI